MTINPNATRGAIPTPTADLTAKSITTQKTNAPAAAPVALGISDITNADEGAPSALGNSVLNQHGLNTDLSTSGQEFINNLSPAHKGQLTEVSGALTPIITAGSGPTGLPNASTDGLQSRWSDFVSDMGAQGGAIDVNALVQSVLRESYQESTQDLKFYAEKVKFFNGVKKQIREELTRARETKSELITSDAYKNASSDDKDSVGVNYAPNGINTTFTGQDTATAAPDAPTTNAELDAYIQGLEEQLSSVGDDAQLANVDLQNMLQKQQQTMQMMSNISKMLHDTGMAIIRKIG